MSDIDDNDFTDNEEELGSIGNGVSPPPKLTRTVSGINHHQWYGENENDRHANDSVSGRGSPMEGAPYPLTSTRSLSGQWTNNTYMNTPSPTRPASHCISELNESMVDITEGSLSNETLTKYIGWDVLNQLAHIAEKQSHRWQSLLLPNNDLLTAIDRAVEIVKNNLDTLDDRAKNEIHVLLEKILIPSFKKIFYDENCNPSLEHMRGILNCICRFINLIVAKLKNEPGPEEVSFEYWYLLRVILDYRNRFYMKTSSMSINTASHVIPGDLDLSLLATYCRPMESFNWYQTVLLWFAQNRGFDLMRQFMQRNVTNSTSFDEIILFLEPIAVSGGIANANSIKNCVGELVRSVIGRLLSLCDKELECEKLKGDIRDSCYLKVYRVCRVLIAHCPEIAPTSDTATQLDYFKLRYLKLVITESIFNTRMSALDELYRTLKQRGDRDVIMSLTTEELELWIESQCLVEALYKDNLHHVAYIDRLENVMGEMFDRQLLSESVLNIIWNAQRGKHDAILRNIHQLTARLVSHFSNSVTDGLFAYLESSWIVGNSKERDVIIDLLRKVGMDFANKETDEQNVLCRVLGFLWDHARNNDTNQDTMLKIMDSMYMVMEETFESHTSWGNIVPSYLERCAMEVATGDDCFVLPILSLLKKLVLLYPSDGERATRRFTRDEDVDTRRYRSGMLRLIEVACTNLPGGNGFCHILVENIRLYMERLDGETPSTSAEGSPSLDDSGSCSTATFHTADLEIRLDFLKFFLIESRGNYECDGEWPSVLWSSVIGSRHIKLRDLGFHFFEKLLRTRTVRIFEDVTCEVKMFNDRVLSMPPDTLSSTGFMCYDAFLKRVNHDKGIIQYNCHVLKDQFILKEINIEGEAYLWRLIMDGSLEVYEQAINLFVAIFTSLDYDVTAVKWNWSTAIVRKCMNHLNEEYSRKVENSVEKERRSTRLRRILQTLSELIDVDEKMYEICRRDRPALRRASIGKGLTVRVSTKVEDFPSIFHGAMPLRPKEDHNQDFFVHDNMLFRQLVSKVTKSLRDIGATVTPYSLILAKRQPGSYHKYDYNEWGCTLRELGMDGFVTLFVKTDRNRIGLDGSDDASFVGIVDELMCKEKEMNLIGVTLSNQQEWVESLVKMADHPDLTEQSLTVLTMIPSCPKKIDGVRSLLGSDSVASEGFLGRILSQNPGARQVYWLMLLQEMILPTSAAYTHGCTKNQELFFVHGGLLTCISLLTSYRLLVGNLYLRTIACSVLVQLIRFGLCVAGILSATGNSPRSSVLERVLERVPSDRELCLREICQSVATSLRNDCNDQTIEIIVKQINVSKETLNRVITLILASTQFASRSPCISMNFDHTFELDHNTMEQDDIGELLAINSLQILALLSVSNQSIAIEMLLSDVWMNCTMVALFDERRTVAESCSDLMATLITAFGNEYPEQHILPLTIDRLFEVIETISGTESSHFWELVCRLVGKWKETGRVVERITERIEKIINWLECAKKQSQDTQCHFDDDVTLCGRLHLCYLLVDQLDSGLKAYYGAKDDGPKMVEKLLNYFLLPSSRAYALMQQQPTLSLEIPRSQTAVEMHTASSSSMFDLHLNANIPRSASALPLPNRSIAVCGTLGSQMYAFDLVAAFCKGSEPCLRLTKDILMDMFYRVKIKEVADRSYEKMQWDYQPDHSLREHGNYVGLKNGGATCYMNSMLQQMFMIPELRNAVINADTTTSVMPVRNGESVLCREREHFTSNSVIEAEYPIKMLQALQTVFAHLVGYELDAYTPKEFWRTFRMNGESMNVHEQQDALEFYNSIVDLVDEGMKKLGGEKVCEKTFGGLFADEKICKDCPHKYTREEPFTSISIDVRAHDNLPASLREYVKGDILENDNAYKCEQCDRKVTAVKRLSVHRLPPHLVVQLKRFEFDWEKEQPVKYNDYFEFPMELDMQPYTAEALAKQDEAEKRGGVLMEEDKAPDPAYLYVLRGVVVHSGQATGGHYYSYIKSSDDGKWYKFDDTDVSRYEASPEDIKYKWFGAETNSGSVSDNNESRRRRPRNWWNAYVLFYEKACPTADSSLNQSNSSNMPVTIDANVSSRRSSTTSPVSRLHKHFSTMSLSSRMRLMPARLEVMVRQENTKIMHERNQYNQNYFRFIHSIVENALQSQSARDQRILLHTIRLYSYFLIFTGLHSSSDLQDEQMRSSWLLLLDKLLHYKQCRLWFVNHIILNEVYSNIYLFQAPTAEVRMFYARAVYRAIIQMFEQEDTMEELLANEVRSVHLDKVLNAFGQRYPPPVGMMFDALIILARNSHDRPIEFYLIIIWMGMDASSQQFNIDTNVFLMMVRHRVLSLLMSLMGTKVIAQLNPHTMLLCAYPKLLCNLLRVVDLRPILQRTVKHEIRDRNPYHLVADSELIPATAIPDWQLSYLMDFVRCKGQKSVYSICEYLLGVAAFYDINSCPSWIRPSICYLAWNNQDCCKFLYDKILACILDDRNSVADVHQDFALTIFRDLISIKDLYHGKDGWLVYLLNYIEFPYGLSRTGQYISPEKNGLMGLMHGGLSHRRQMDMLRCIVLLVEEYGDLAVQVFKTSPENASVAMDVQTTFVARYNITEPLEPVRTSELPTRLDVIHRWIPFVRKLQDLMDQEQEDLDQEPLDLSVGASRSSTTTPQSGDKRPFPEEDSESPSGRKDSKKFNDGSETSKGAVDEMLLATSSSASDSQNQKPKSPPPAYDYTDLEPPGLENTEPSKKVAMSTLPAWNHS